MNILNTVLNCNYMETVKSLVQLAFQFLQPHFYRSVVYLLCNTNNIIIHKKTLPPSRCGQISLFTMTKIILCCQAFNVPIQCKNTINFHYYKYNRYYKTYLNTKYAGFKLFIIHQNNKM